jgi:hypothetical protein
MSETTARRIPPVTELSVVTMVLVIAGGIDLASHLPKPAPLGPAVALLGVATLCLAANVVVLSRIKDFAWPTFRLVAGWALAAYVVVAGMLEYVFVLDHTRGRMLLVLTLMLGVYAVNIPLLLGFSVARYQPSRP